MTSFLIALISGHFRSFHYANALDKTSFWYQNYCKFFNGFLLFKHSWVRLEKPHNFAASAFDLSFSTSLHTIQVCFLKSLVKKLFYRLNYIAKSSQDSTFYIAYDWVMDFVWLSRKFGIFCNITKKLSQIINFSSIFHHSHHFRRILLVNR